ncbi:MAG TPA: TetR/AcrR family transcriptional regulator [Lachnospiraceae bacterium]|nr:TetR/AcrR family transcriptional regulator [Lachnospiraceae bacterium]
MDRKKEFAGLIENAESTKQKLFYTGLDLFSQKGFANVGIRELCYSVHVKESAFYNHYAGKEKLLEAILNYFDETSSQVIMSDDEIAEFVKKGDVRYFFTENMKRFSMLTSNILYHTALQIVLTESFLHPLAGEMAKKNLYHLRKDYTEKVLCGLMECKAVKKCDAELVTAEYYYALKGILDEYLLLETWESSMSEIKERLKGHIEFFAALLEYKN